MTTPVKIHVEYQGEVFVEDAFGIRAKATIHDGSKVKDGGEMAAIRIHATTKYTRVLATVMHFDKASYPNGLPGIELVSQDSGEVNPTVILFPEYEGWTVHSAMGGIYTITVCLMKGYEP